MGDVSYQKPDIYSYKHIWNSQGSIFQGICSLFVVLSELFEIWFLNFIKKQGKRQFLSFHVVEIHPHIHTHTPTEVKEVVSWILEGEILCVWGIPEHGTG